MLSTERSQLRFLIKCEDEWNTFLELCYAYSILMLWFQVVWEKSQECKVSHGNKNVIKVSLAYSDAALSGCVSNGNNHR